MPQRNICPFIEQPHKPLPLFVAPLMKALHFLSTKSSLSSSCREIFVCIELLKRVDLGVSVIEFRSLAWCLAAS